MEYFTRPQLKRQKIQAYGGIIAPDLSLELTTIVRKLGGMSIVHINTAANSGGVAEILKCQVPLERSLGLDSNWVVMRGEEKFFTVTKKIHNLLQGQIGELTPVEQDFYLLHNNKRSTEFRKILTGYTRLIVVIHDPQPLSLIRYVPREVRAVSRLHLDLSQSDAETFDFLRPFVLQADAVMLSDKRFRPTWMPEEKVAISFPAIDPLSEKNLPMLPARVRDVLSLIGLDPARPVMTQVSRFDPWKDPQGVVASYRIAKKIVPNLQLAMAGLIVAEDDPEAKGIYGAMQRECANDPDIHLFGENVPPAGLSNDVFINALQSGSTVVVQKSLKEGFGLTVTEAMWKRAAVVAGRVGGILHQIAEGKNGYLIDSVEACATRVAELMHNPKLREHIGTEARESVRKQFLMPRLVLDHLKMYQQLLETETGVTRDVPY